MAQPILTAPTFEHHHDGFGISTALPRISWRFEASRDGSEIPKNWIQCGYAIEIAKEGENSGKVYQVESLDSVLVPWPGVALRSRDQYSVRVKAYTDSKTGGAKLETEWSPWSKVEAAFFERADWKSHPIAAVEKFQEDGATLRPVRFRKTFSHAGGPQIIKMARLHITAFGVYEAYLNGHRIGDQVLAPGWQSYSHRQHYQIFDVTPLLGEENVIAVEVAEGWYAGRLGDAKRRQIYGSQLGLLAQLEITNSSESGEMVVLCTDESWKCHKSAIVTSELYDGEVYDMREESLDWKTAYFDDSDWGKVETLAFPTAKLVSPDTPPVRVTQEVKPIAIMKSPTGKTIVDFGQNLVGVIRVRSLEAQSGHRVSFSHAEVLEDGEMAMRPLRTAKCTDAVISSGKVLLDWSPKFTFHGFRYMQVSGWPDGTAATKADFTALVLHTDMKRRGWFNCSNNLINKFHDNVVWGMRGNFLSLPTDCPARDERLGWTGDAQIFAKSATFLFNTISTLSTWLEDVSAEQLAQEDAIPGLVVPNIFSDTWPAVAQAVWHDVVVLTPWDLFSFSSDRALLQRQYASMKAYLERAIPRGPDQLWDPDVSQLGDWLDPAAPVNEPGNSLTDGVLVADSYLIHTTQTFSQVCEAIGEPHEALYAASDAACLKEAFQEKYITRAGLLVNQTQTALSLAIVFDLFPLSLLPVAVESLGRQVRASKFHIATGFAGTPVICHALTKTGQTDLAYRMMLEKHCPSWLYPVTMGATTVWERWDGLLPDGKLNPGSMLSFNHYALGSVANWLHTTVAGISSVDGWKTVVVAPEPGGEIDSAESSFDGPYGMVKCSWTLKDGHFALNLTIPPNSSAKVTLPGGVIAKAEVIDVGSGRHDFSRKYQAVEWPPCGPPQPFWGSSECDCGS